MAASGDGGRLPRRRSPAPGAQRERGSSLLIAIVALCALLLGVVAVMQSTYATSDIVGNSARKQAATQAADVALQAATTQLAGLASVDTTVAGAYSPVRLAADANGLPTVGWDAVPSSRVGSFSVQYLIDRLCDPPLPVVDAKTQCAAAAAASDATSHKVGAPTYDARPAVYYRVTARVVGPKGSESYVQAVLSR